MFRRLRRPITALLAGLLAVVISAAAQEPSSSFAPIEPVLTEPEPVHQWLEEVRAQRLAREERRRAAKEAREAHRRWIDPWGAAQRKIREQENQRRHEAFMEHIERDRETFRNQVPWGLNQGPWQDGTTQPPAQPVLPTEIDAEEISGQEVSSTTSSYPPPGWDNRWYYRGF